MSRELLRFGLEASRRDLVGLSSQSQRGGGPLCQNPSRMPAYHTLAGNSQGLVAGSKEELSVALAKSCKDTFENKSLILLLSVAFGSGLRKHGRELRHIHIPRSPT